MIGPYEDEIREFTEFHEGQFGCTPRLDDQQPDFSLAHSNRWITWLAAKRLSSIADQIKSEMFDELVADRDHYKRMYEQLISKGDQE